LALIKFTKAIYEGSVISLYNKGNMMRDFTYIDDVIAALCEIISKPFQQDGHSKRSATSSAPFEIIYIGNAAPIKMGDYVNVWRRLLVKRKIFSYYQMDYEI
jgi:UDP-glucuronate 4-epimerase